MMPQVFPFLLFVLSLALPAVIFLTTSAAASPALPQADERYSILSSSALLDRLLYLSTQYPTFCTLTTTQEWFGLPRAGDDADCQFDASYYKATEGGATTRNEKGCNNYVLIIHDKEAYPDDPDVQLGANTQQQQQFPTQNIMGGYEQPSGWKFVPDVFLSGSVHGNERVGPTSLIEMSTLLLEAAHCESLPRMKFKPVKATEGDDNGDHWKEEDRKFSKEEWDQELANAISCRQSLTMEWGVPSPLRQWLARLVSTRRTIIIPTANALGYSRNKREEGNIDPNRDFPFDIEQYHESECMQTIAGRSINELWQSHLFQIGLTFHGGMEVIGYEWGAPTYLNWNAPDALAQEQIAQAYSRYSNGFPGHSPYDYGTMNDKVYYVRGGMEDWAFAGSWDPDRVVQCTPDTYGGYEKKRTTYNNSTLRAFNMLIETSDKKEPSREDLGTRRDPLISGNGRENGHVARNIRLALLAMDVVEPYVSIRGVEGLIFEDDVVPTLNLKRSTTSYYDDAKLVWVPSDVRKKITWTVGGAINIDSTEIVFGLWDALPTQLMENTNGFYPSIETRKIIDASFQTAQPSNIQGGNSSGRSRWHADGAYPAGSNVSGQSYNFDPIFEADIDTGNIPSGTAIAVFARAMVDKDWATVSPNVNPTGLGPVSHIVNARTNPTYFASNAGKVIYGREYGWWYSDPITIVVGDAKEARSWDIDVNDPMGSGLTHFSLSSNDDGIVTAVHMNARFADSPAFADTWSGSNPRGKSSSPRRGISTSAALVLMLLISIGIIIRLIRSRRRHAFRRPVATHEREDVDDELVFDTSMYLDNVDNEELGDVEATFSKRID